MSTHKSVARSAGIISSGILTSRILGFIRDVVVANFFGLGLYAQVFVVAFRIPNILRHFVAEGVTNSAFVPVFSEYRLKYGKNELWQLANVVLSILILVLAAITLLGVILSPLIVRLIAPGFIAEPEKLEATIFLGRLFFPYIFFVGLAAFTMGLLHTFKHFTAPAFASCFFNISLIVFISIYNRGIRGLALGVLVGGFLQLAVQIPPLLKKGFRPDLFKKWRHPGAARIGRLMLPRLASSGIYQFNTLIHTILASFSGIVGTGAVAALYFANRLFQLPLAIFGIALSQAILPSMSEDAIAGRIEDLKNKVSFGLRCTFLLTLPSAAGLMLLSRPIVRALFERGAFSAYSTQITSGALVFYCIGLFAYAASSILSSCFFSLKDTLTPAKIAAATLFGNVVFCLIFMGPLKIRGLALGMSLAGIANFLMLFFSLQRKIGSLGTGRIFRSFFKIVLASFVMALVCRLVYGHFLAGAHTTYARACLLILTIIFGITTFVLAAVLFRVSEMKELLRWPFKRQ